MVRQLCLAKSFIAGVFLTVNERKLRKRTRGKLAVDHRIRAAHMGKRLFKMCAEHMAAHCFAQRECNNFAVDPQQSAAHPERFDELTGKFTALLKQIHHTCVPEKDEFPSEKDHWLSWAEGMRPYYSEDETGLLLKMLQGIPERSTIVHCDFHENNVMVRGNELILIDMSDIGRGHPIFDLAGGAFRAHVSRIPGRQAHHGLPAEMMERFWDTVLRMYFETEDPDKIKKLQDMCLAFGLVRSALFPMKHVQIGEKLRQIHIDDARRNLFPRKEWALQQMESLNVVLPDVQA